MRELAGFAQRGVGASEKVELVFWDFFSGQGFFGLKVLEDGSGAFNQTSWQAGDASDFDSVTFVDSAFFDLVEEKYTLGSFLDVD